MAEPRVRESLDAWVLSTMPHAIAYAASLLKDRSLADDVVHDCYCRLLRKADVYDLLRDGTKILFKAITNACINRTTRAKPTVSLDGLGADERAAEAIIRDRRAVDPVDAAMGRELQQAVAEGLAQLPATQRAALELKSLGYSMHEIADALEVSATNAGVLVHRARQTLAECLGAYLEEQ